MKILPLMLALCAGNIKEMREFLESSKYIDWDNHEVQKLTKSLSSGLSSEEEIAKNCFEWVRDNIKHSSDYKLNPVTCKASDVLKCQTGKWMDGAFFSAIAVHPTITCIGQGKQV